jgi:hypothetical protein
MREAFHPAVPCNPLSGIRLICSFASGKRGTPAAPSARSCPPYRTTTVPVHYTRAHQPCTYPYSHIHPSPVFPPEPRHRIPTPAPRRTNAATTPWRDYARSRDAPFCGMVLLEVSEGLVAIGDLIKGVAENACTRSGGVRVQGSWCRVCGVGGSSVGAGLWGEALGPFEATAGGAWCAVLRLVAASQARCGVGCRVSRLECKCWVRGSGFGVRGLGM